MAIATLAACYNNPNVFTGVVKIRKGQAVALMMGSTNMTQFQTIMTQFAEEVSKQHCFLCETDWSCLGISSNRDTKPVFLSTKCITSGPKLCLMVL